ncbi:hypothetical protein HNR77_006028 [Paenibacillus sp. JGP012]|nr:hypothetical protein [Paenibacillus sp. JGP012]
MTEQSFHIQIKRIHTLMTGLVQEQKVDKYVGHFR